MAIVISLTFLSAPRLWARKACGAVTLKTQNHLPFVERVAFRELALMKNLQGKNLDISRNSL
jgi:hypothetical protein